MIGLLLPLWLNLGGGSAPVHHDAPGARKIPVIPESRTIAVPVEPRVIAVPTESRVILVGTDDEPMEVRTKDPDDTLDFTRDFGGFLDASETLSSVAWSVPAGLTLGTGSYAPTVSADGKRCTAWLIGGTAGVTYEVRARATTSNSPARIKDASFKLEVEEQ